MAKVILFVMHVKVMCCHGRDKNIPVIQVLRKSKINLDKEMTS